MSKTIPPATTDLGTYGFPRSHCERIGRVTTRVEGEYLNPVSGRARWPVGAVGTGLIPLLLPSGIGAGTYSSPATKTDVTLLKQKDDDAGYTTDGALTNQPLYSCYKTAITGTDVFAWGVKQNGRIYLVTADC